MLLREFFDYQLRTRDIEAAKGSLPALRCPECGGSCIPWWDDFPHFVTIDYLVSGLGAQWELTYLCCGDCEQEWQVETLEVNPDTGQFVNVE